MATQVKIFSYSGIAMAPVSSFAEQKADQSIAMLNGPYLAGESINAGAGGASSSQASTAPAGTKVLRIEVEQGKKAFVEVNPPNAVQRVATANSPTYQGIDLMLFGAGWTISVLGSA